MAIEAQVSRIAAGNRASADICARLFRAWQETERDRVAGIKGEAVESNPLVLLERQRITGADLCTFDFFCSGNERLMIALLVNERAQEQVESVRYGYAHAESLLRGDSDGVLLMALARSHAGLQ